MNYTLSYIRNNPSDFKVCPSGHINDIDNNGCIADECPHQEGSYLEEESDVIEAVDNQVDYLVNYANDFKTDEEALLSEITVCDRTPENNTIIHNDVEYQVIESVTSGFHAAIPSDMKPSTFDDPASQTRLWKSRNKDDVEIDFYSCDCCGKEIGLDASYIEQVESFDIPCPFCGEEDGGFISTDDN